MQRLVAALHVVIRKTVVNCYRKFKKSKERHKEAIAKDSKIFKEMEKEI